MRSKILSLRDVSETFCYNLNKISKLSILLTRWGSEFKKGIKKTCRDQDSNLGYCGHNAVS